jgi:hypothetical protein
MPSRAAARSAVVEVLAVDGGAVEEGGTGGAQRLRVPDRGARPRVVERRASARDVVVVARRDAQADRVDQQVLALGLHAGRQRLCSACRDALGQVLGNRLIGKG